MHLKLIACEVLLREICHCVAQSPHVVDLEFTEKGDHDRSNYLRELIQSKIDAAEQSSRKYDAILLGYGLCGNSTVDIISRKIPIVIPRAHDCCTLFLGSKTRFKEHFADNPSLPFSSAGYMERGDSYLRESSIKGLPGCDKTFEEYVKLYGEENARYIFETLDLNKSDKHFDKVCFIRSPMVADLGHADQCRVKATSEGREYVEIPGDFALVNRLVFGEWSNEDFLILNPQQRVKGVYDWDEIIRAENIS